MIVVLYSHAPAAMRACIASVRARARACGWMRGWAEAAYVTTTSSFGGMSSVMRRTPSPNDPTTLLTRRKICAGGAAGCGGVGGAGGPVEGRDRSGMLFTKYSVMWYIQPNVAVHTSSGASTSIRTAKPAAMPQPDLARPPVRRSSDLRAAHEGADSSRCEAGGREPRNKARHG